MSGGRCQGTHHHRETTSPDLPVQTRLIRLRSRGIRRPQRRMAEAGAILGDQRALSEERRQACQKSIAGPSPIGRRRKRRHGAHRGALELRGHLPARCSALNRVIFGSFNSQCMRLAHEGAWKPDLGAAFDAGF